jgi:XTP/dITP diphosphohydrolase
VLTVLLTSRRVAPGLLTWQAWSALRAASRVLAASAGHPQIPALTAAGVIAEVVEPPADVNSLAELLSAGGPDDPVVWLAPPGEAADAALLTAISSVAGPARVLHGSHDLPGSHLLDVVETMDRLRVSCPWDREQTHASLLPYLLEEAYEAAETIETGSVGAALREELGDVLFQAVFHARIAAERAASDGGFTIDDVADVLTAKLIRRHPHVFGSVSVSSASDVNRNWEEIKKAERAERAVASGSGSPSVLDGVAFGQPALSLAAQVQRRAERAGVPGEGAEPPSSPAAADGAASLTAAELGAEPPSLTAAELGDEPPSLTAAELGDELMRVVARARAAGLDPELELRAAARRFAERVREWEWDTATKEKLGNRRS